MPGVVICCADSCHVGPRSDICVLRSHRMLSIEPRSSAMVDTCAEVFPPKRGLAFVTLLPELVFNKGLVGPTIVVREPGKLLLPVMNPNTYRVTILKGEAVAVVDFVSGAVNVKVRFEGRKKI